MSQTRIPRSIDELNNYLKRTTAYLQDGTPVTNAARLGLLETEVSAWTGINTTWEPLYDKYSDRKNSYTTTVREKLLECMDNLVSLNQDNRILDRIAASPNVTIDDLEMFNIKGGTLQKTTRSNSTTPITENVTVTLQPVGGGLINIKCYSVSGQRACIFDEADCVQYIFLIGNTPPDSVKAAGMIKEISTKAIFTLSLGAENSKQTLYIYFRWYNTRHPELSGPWSAMQNTVII